ncbi:PucR family transcriptional regulator [Streptomyces sp. AJS327]|uniref:PucR family transcriptional regulator n=1 Tax=Streptomyces sp. AJS327 TaxID=2545265 RepID=UPI0015DD9463|nr:PucR family transcriptional regulator [Streptomyces sp. AJS327]MBA0053701.1 PucR family transcriptional regulator [Streptomyces sp. AJS327]
MALVDLAAACDRLAEATSCPAVLEDPEYRVLAYSAVPGQAEDPARSAAILRRRTPDAWLRWISDQTGAASIDDGAIHVVADPWPGLRRRAIKALRTGGELVGYLWLLEGERGFPPDSSPAVERFEAHVLPVVAADTTSEVTRLDSRMIRRIVEGALSEKESAEFLGVSPGGSVVVSCFLLPGDGFTPVADVAAVLDAVRTRDGSEKVALVGSRIARFERLGDRTSASVQDGVAAAARRLQRVTRGPVFAVSSRPVTVPALAGGWREVTQGASTLRKLSRAGRYAPFDQLRVAIALDVVQQAVAAHRDLFDALLEPLAAADRSGELLGTLATTLREDGSVSRAAAQLRLHQNSVRYRTGKIRETLGLDLDEPGTRLALRLATSGMEEVPVPGREL